MIPEFCLWTVYFNPSDFPGKYVGRRFVLTHATADHIVADDIEIVRNWISQQCRKHGGAMVPMNRSADDDPTIVEVWL